MVVKNPEPLPIGAQIAPPFLTATHLLKTKQYDDLAEYFYEAQLSIQENSELSLLSEILFSARQICQACSTLENEAEWHRRAADEAEHRKQTLERSLQNIAVMISNEIARIPTSPSAPIAVLKKPAPGEARTMNWSDHSLRQRLPNLRKTDSRLLRRVDDVALVKLKQVEVDERMAVHETVAVSPAQATATEKLEFPMPVKAEKIAIPALYGGTERTHSAESQQPSMVVYGLGGFRVHLNDQPVENWSNRKARSIFKYLLLSRARPVAKEVLMERFWPDSDPEAARNNLNVAIYNLRQALRKVDRLSSHILFQDDCYLLNPDFKIWMDFEAFNEHYKKGQQLELAGKLVEAVREYGVAETLYQGPLFEEDRYEDWPTSQRQTLQDAYLHLLDRLSTHYFSTENYSAGINMGNKMLAVDSCREDAHRLLMQCYARQGQPYLALRQYHACVEAHKKELDTIPSSETTRLYEQIRSNQTF